MRPSDATLSTEEVRDEIEKALRSRISNLIAQRLPSVNVSKAHEQYTTALCKSLDELTEQEKMQAVLAAVLDAEH